MKRFILLGLLVLMTLPATIYALPTISCHCFQDRSFDPARPSAADGYYLATAQNRLMAAVFERPRREIVMAKQTGTSGSDLWIAYQAAAISGHNSATLLSARKDQGAWWPVLEKQGIDLAPRLGEATRVSASLDRQIVAATLAELGFANLATVADLYGDGAGSQEAILAVVLASARKQPPREIWQSVATGEKSWGSLLDEAGMTADLDAAFERLLGGGKE